MLVWVLAGVVLGLVLGHVVRKVPHSPSVELTYITLADLFRPRRKTQTIQPPTQGEKPSRGWKAAAGRLNLF